MNGNDERQMLHDFGLWCILAGVGLGILLTVVIWRLV